MTNSNDALRAALGDKTAVEKIAILSNQDWQLARVDMAATLDMIHEIAVAAIYPASPVAGGDLREALVKADRELSRCRNAMDASTFNGRNRTESALAEVKRLTAALNQPAAPVEAVEPVAWVYDRPNDGKRYTQERLIDFGRHPLAVEGGWTETPLYAHPPEPAASTVARGEGCHLPPQGWICTRGQGHDGPCAAYRPSRWDGVPELIEAITEDEGATVTITGQNPDFNGLPNECVIVCGPTTDWQDKHFSADTLADCLRAATHHKGSSDGQ